jgi:hypothetical protein
MEESKIKVICDGDIKEAFSRIFEKLRDNFIEEKMDLELVINFLGNALYQYSNGNKLSLQEVSEILDRMKKGYEAFVNASESRKNEKM